MPLERVSTILKNADKRKCGVIAFDVFHYESIAWIIETAEEEQVPVIIMLHPFMFKHLSASTCFEMVKDLASRTTVPIGLHLDHSESFDEIMGAIAAGFRSVMIDGSRLDFEENIRVTREVAKAAHPMGVDVEAELGRVGIASNLADFQDERLYTTVDSAVEFVARTGVDSLAIAIGSAHGHYVATPHLDLQRLDEINRAIQVPLVLHGGSGIPEDQLRQAAALGINKLNVGTEFIHFFYTMTRTIMEEKRTKEDMLMCLLALKPDMKRYLRDKIHILGL